MATSGKSDIAAQEAKDNKHPEQNVNPASMRFHHTLLAPLLGGAAQAIPFGMENALTTANVPREFLSDVYFVGQVPVMALQADPRISYGLYVPEEFYNPDPSRYAEPAKLPLLVDIHGTTRVYTNVFEGLRPFAASAPCAVLAPLFPAGLEGPNDIDSYKVLHTDSLRADLALLRILDEVAYRWPGLATDQVFMMAYSGGGQFAQRFLYLYPERLAAVSIGAPGRVTNLDFEKNWPEGVADTEAIFNRTVDPARIAEVPIQLVVGSEDTETHGEKAFWEWLSKVMNETGGGGGGGGELPDMDQSRLKTLQDLQASWKSVGIETQLDIVPGIKHEAAKARDTVLNFLRPFVQKKCD